MNIIGNLTDEQTTDLLAFGNVADIRIAQRPIAKVMRFTSSIPDIEGIYLKGLYSKDFYVWRTSWVNMYNEAVAREKGNRDFSIYKTQFVWWASGRDIYLNSDDVSNFDPTITTYNVEDALALAKSTNYAQGNIWGGNEDGNGLFLVNNLHTFYAVRRAFELYRLGDGAFYNFRVQLINPAICYEKYKAIVAIGDAFKSIPIKGGHIFHYKNLKSSWAASAASQRDWDSISTLIK